MPDGSATSIICGYLARKGDGVNIKGLKTGSGERTDLFLPQFFIDRARGFF
jgi:hypothetical protein